MTLEELRRQRVELSKEIAIIEASMKWPIITDIFVYGPEMYEIGIESINKKSYDFDDDFDSAQQNQFRYLVYEMKVRCELHENGDTFWTHINNVKLPKKMRAS